MQAKELNIFYVHGMGGGGDSRIPSILNEYFEPRYFMRQSDDSQTVKVRIIVKTYDFDPEVAAVQIRNWLDEYHPVMIIGESLGSIHAIRISGLPHLLVSPSLGAPFWLGYCAPLIAIPGMKWILDQVFKRREGDRQEMVFRYSYVKKYLKHGRLALANSPLKGSQDQFFAFFGKHDHYRRSGVVSIRMYRKYFGQTYAVYDGTHFMEEEFLHTLLIPKICRILELVHI